MTTVRPKERFPVFGVRYPGIPERSYSPGRFVWRPEESPDANRDGRRPENCRP